MDLADINLIDSVTTVNYAAVLEAMPPLEEFSTVPASIDFRPVREGLYPCCLEEWSCQRFKKKFRMTKGKDLHLLSLPFVADHVLQTRNCSRQGISMAPLFGSPLLNFKIRIVVVTVNPEHSFGQLLGIGLGK